jgi:hypothetical protein
MSPRRYSAVKMTHSLSFSLTHRERERGRAALPTDDIDGSGEQQRHRQTGGEKEGRRERDSEAGEEERDWVSWALRVNYARSLRGRPCSCRPRTAMREIETGGRQTQHAQQPAWIEDESRATVAATACVT